MSLCDVACFCPCVLLGLSVCRRRLTVFFVCVYVALYVFCPCVLCILTQPISKNTAFLPKKVILNMNKVINKKKKKKN